MLIWNTANANYLIDVNAITIIGDNIMVAVKQFFKALVEAIQEYKMYKAGKVK
jgi:hypothetical protein